MRPRICQLDNPIQHYAWGSREAIARLQGRPFPTALPEAELWIGDHPTAPSRVLDRGTAIPLPDWIARDPGAVLGPGLDHLPFLAKVLAAECSLSVQVHPDERLARSGWERESAAGLPDEARSYRDANPKHEVLVALTSFEALCGLREDAAVAAAIEPVETLRALAAEPSEGPLALRLLHGLQRLTGESRSQLLVELERFAGGSGSDSQICRRLLNEHPGDALAAAPFILNSVRLEPGQALVVRPGTVHSYLSGTGVEVMTRSDNVVRAGLTPKHVDAAELLAVAAPRVGDADIQSPTARAGAIEYDTGTTVFRLRRLSIDRGERLGRPGGRVSVVLCVRGEVAVAESAGRDSAAVRLVAGQAGLVPARIEAFQLLASDGPAELFEVSTQ